MTTTPKDLDALNRELMIPTTWCRKQWSTYLFDDAPYRAADAIAALREQLKQAQNSASNGASLVNELKVENAALKRRLTVLTEVLADSQFSMNGYCPSCGGWNSNPKDPKRGDSPGFHTKTCPIAKAIDAAMREGKE